MKLDWGRQSWQPPHLNLLALFAWNGKWAAAGPDRILPSLDRQEGAAAAKIGPVKVVYDFRSRRSSLLLFLRLAAPFSVAALTFLATLVYSLGLPLPGNM